MFCAVPPSSPTIVGRAVETMVWGERRQQQREHQGAEDGKPPAPGTAVGGC
jgi:hypothetical protein